MANSSKLTLRTLSGVSLIALLSGMPLVHAETIIDGGNIVTIPGDFPSPWNISGLLYVGNYSPGTLNIINGGVVNTGDTVYLARSVAGPGSLIIVDGVGSQLNINLGGSELYVGTTDGAEMTVSNGGSVLAGNVEIGYNTLDSIPPDSRLTVNGAGSQLVSNYLKVGGYNTNAIMEVLNGATVSASSIQVGTSDSAGGSARLVVDGSGSRLLSNDLQLGFTGAGYYSRAVMEITRGGYVSASFASIGTSPDHSDQLVVDGAGSELVVTDTLTVGGPVYGNQGRGILQVAHQGQVSASTVNLTGLYFDPQLSSAVLAIGALAGETPIEPGTLAATSVSFGDGQGNIVFNHTDTSGNYAFSAPISGIGTVDVYAGHTVLTGENTYGGLTTLYGGTLAAGGDNRFSAFSDYDVRPAGVLDLQGFSQTVNSLNNGGLVRITNVAEPTLAFAGSPGTILTVTGDYIGSGGVIEIGTALGGDDSATDKLVINGDTSGTSYVAVKNLGGMGAATLEGIEIIQVNGLSDGEFANAGRIVAGVFDYSVVRGTGGNVNNWYLISRETPVEPIDPEDPSDPPAYPVDPNDPESPLYPVDPNDPFDPRDPMVERPEPGAYSANLAAANMMFVTRLHDRLGETQYIDALTGERKFTSMWLRNEGGHNRSRDNHDQLRTQANRYVLQLGGDIAQWSQNGQDRFHLGLMAGYGNTKSNTVAHSGYDAKGTVTGYSVGAYATWYANQADKSGLYVDGWLQYSWFNNSVNGQSLAGENYKSKGITASIESGYSFKVGENSAKTINYFIQPQAQLTWMGVKADDHTEVNGTRVTGEGDGNLQSRVGVKAFMDIHHGIDQAVQPFVEINWLHNSKDFGTNMNGISVKQDGAANIAELKLGVEGQVNKQVNLWGNVGQQVGNKGYSDTSVMLGAKYNF